MCFPTPGRCIRLVCCPSQHDWCLIKGTAGADIHRTLIREARIFFLIYNLCKHLASSPISKTSLSSTTSSTSSTSPDFAQPCISYNLYNLYNLCAILHLLSALLALHLLHRKIDALHIRSRYILRSCFWSPDGQIWSYVFRQATFAAYLNKVVDCCWSSIARVLPILWFDDMHIWGSSHCVIFQWQ